MNEKLGSLIKVLAQIHEKINNIYKNIESIDGQYNEKLKLTAKVLALQTQSKIRVYNVMLMDALELEIDITSEGYAETLELLKECEKAIKNKKNLDKENLVNTAIAFSNAKIDLLKGVLIILDRYEKEKNITHYVIKEKVKQILNIEEQDVVTLKSFQ